MVMRVVVVGAALWRLSFRVEVEDEAEGSTGVDVTLEVTDVTSWRSTCQDSYVSNWFSWEGFC